MVPVPALRAWAGDMSPKKNICLTRKARSWLLSPEWEGSEKCPQRPPATSACQMLGGRPAIWESHELCAEY